MNTTASCCCRSTAPLYCHSTHYNPAGKYTVLIRYVHIRDKAKLHVAFTHGQEGKLAVGRAHGLKDEGDAREFTPVVGFVHGPRQAAETRPSFTCGSSHSNC